MNSQSKITSVKILAGQATSESIRTDGFANIASNPNASSDNKQYAPKGIFLPITTQTSFGFEVSLDNDAWFTLKDAANAAIAVTKTAGSASAHPLSAQSFAGWPWFRVVAGGNEGAERVINFAGYEV